MRGSAAVRSILLGMVLFVGTFDRVAAEPTQYTSGLACAPAYDASTIPVVRTSHAITNTGSQTLLVRCLLDFHRPLAAGAEGAIVLGDFALDATLYNGSDAPVTLACTAHVLTGNVRFDTTRRTTLAARSGGRIRFSTADMPATDEFSLPGLACQLPEDVALGLIVVRLPSFTAR